MWRKLLSHLQAPPADHAAQQRLAIAVLLLECARADFERSEVEMTVVREALRTHLSLDGSALDALLNQAGEAAQRAVSLHDFVQQLNQGLQPADKRELILMLWRVAYADGRLDPNEEALIRSLADLLYLPHHDFIAAKLQAQAGDD